MKRLFIDLFCGSSSFKAEAESHGFEYFGVDWEKYEHVSLQKDIGELKLTDLPPFSQYDKIHIHASPDCKTYTIAAISHHRDGVKPKSEYAIKCDKVNSYIFADFFRVVNSLYGNKTSWSVENPRGMLRKMSFMSFLKMDTVWYCQYGDDRAKPTDIWTFNLNWTPKPCCHNGNKNCHHQSAPRGSKTGTQGRKGSYERSKIPNELCKEIVLSIG